MISGLHMYLEQKPWRELRLEVGYSGRRKVESAEQAASQSILVFLGENYICLKDSVQPLESLLTCKPYGVHRNT
jgi:hypothetical protein